MRPSPRRYPSGVSRRALRALAVALAPLAACGPGAPIEVPPAVDLGEGVVVVDDAGLPVGGAPAMAEAAIGPIDLPPGHEITLCMHVKLDLAEPIFVKRFS